MTKQEKQEHDEAVKRLREVLKPGDSVKVYVRSVSRSGMSRVIVPIKIMPDGSTFHLGWLAARALGWRTDDNHGVKVGGCGMDMGFHLVYSLGHELWPSGYGCMGEGCRSNDHSNGDRDYTPHGICTDCREATHAPSPGHEHKHWHRDGGYALRHDWI